MAHLTDVSASDSELSTDSTSPAAYLTIDQLTKKFGEFVALDRISLSIQEGEFICFLGPSGCGKTTLLRAIAGLDIQTSGTVHQAGKNISPLPPSERDFGIVFQSYALFPNLTIEKNIAFGLENQKASRPDIERRVEELLALVGLPDQGKKYPAQLSGGQQQRIALARAIACSPGLLLLDEPLSALDAKVRTHLRHEIKKLQRRLGVTTIMVTHDQEEALTMADRIVVMNHGIIEQIGTPTDIYREPQTLFVADFIGEMNQLQGQIEDDDHATVGRTTLKVRQHNLSQKQAAIITMRPEDIVPHGKGARSPGAPDPIEQRENVFETRIDDMEFLGSFWRLSLLHADWGDTILQADLSINAIKRMSLTTGDSLMIELPVDRLQTFVSEGSAS